MGLLFLCGLVSLLVLWTSCKEGGGKGRRGVAMGPGHSGSGGTSGSSRRAMGPGHSGSGGTSGSSRRAPIPVKQIPITKGSAPVSWRSDLSKTDIWYATFGSNMRKRRFLCYIKGGKVKGMKTSLRGSKDQNPPKKILWRTFTHRRLFFGREKTVTWGWGGVAFLHPKRKNKEDIVHMRLYRITLEQFNDVLRQENGSSYDMRSPLFHRKSLDRIKEKGSINSKTLEKGFYSNIVYLGMEQDIPILTMTCTTSDIKSGKVPQHPPSKDYANTLVSGLVDEGPLTEKKAKRYIKKAEAPLTEKKAKRYIKKAEARLTPNK